MEIPFLGVTSRLGSKACHPLSPKSAALLTPFPPFPCLSSCPVPSHAAAHSEGGVRGWEAQARCPQEPLGEGRAAGGGRGAENHQRRRRHPEAREDHDRGGGSNHRSGILNNNQDNPQPNFFCLVPSTHNVFLTPELLRGEDFAGARSAPCCHCDLAFLSVVILSLFCCCSSSPSVW